MESEFGESGTAAEHSFPVLVWRTDGFTVERELDLVEIAEKGCLAPGEVNTDKRDVLQPR
jgi:hypothetical protein